MIVPVILAGGSGTRLWPLSRALYPKQMLDLVGDNTMLQDTVLRLRAIPGWAPRSSSATSTIGLWSPSSCAPSA